MTTAPALRPAPTGLPPSRCPDCGAPLVTGDEGVVRCGCAGEVGTVFCDLHGRRLPLRPVYATTPERPCAACGGSRQRVLVGADIGVACAGCGAVVRRVRAPRAIIDRPFSHRGLVVEAAVIVAIGVALATIIAWWGGLTGG